MTPSTHPILLLVEDNPLLTSMYVAALEKAGFSVFKAHNTEDGLRLAKEKKPKGIVLDLLLPGEDGFSAMEKLKADETTKAIGIVVLTSVETKEAKEHAKKLGAVDYLVKPSLTLAEIVERVKVAYS